MKWSKCLAFMSLLTLAGSALAEDKVYGTCSLMLTGNDARSGAFSSIQALKESEMFYSFEVPALTRYEIKNTYIRVIPHADDINKYRKYQVALFEGDKKSLNTIYDEGIPYATRSISGTSYVAIGYAGENQTGGAQVSVDVTGPRGEVNRKRLFPFDAEGKSEFKFDYKVKFNYRDLGGDGFLSLGGDVGADDLKNAKVKVHEARVEVKCSVFKNEVAENSSRDMNKEDNSVDPEIKGTVPKTEFSESEIIRKPKGIED